VWPTYPVADIAALQAVTDLCIFRSFSVAGRKPWNSLLVTSVHSLETSRRQTLPSGVSQADKRQSSAIADKPARFSRKRRAVYIRTASDEASIMY